MTTTLPAAGVRPSWVPSAPVAVTVSTPALTVHAPSEVTTMRAYPSTGLPMPAKVLRAIAVPPLIATVVASATAWLPMRRKISATLASGTSDVVPAALSEPADVSTYHALTRWAPGVPEGSRTQLPGCPRQSTTVTPSGVSVDVGR